MVHKLGIKIKGYFMLGHIIDTKETIRETINFSKSLPLFSANYSIFVPTPGSEFYDLIYLDGSQCKEYAFATYATADKSLLFVPAGLTAKYLIQMQKRAFIEFFCRFSQILLYLRSIHTFEDIRRFAIMFYAGVTLITKITTIRLAGFYQNYLKKYWHVKITKGFRYRL